MNNRVHRLFSASIENRILAADQLEKQIAQAAKRLVECLLRNGTIFISGESYACFNAQYFTSVLLNHVELERPALPVILLASDDVQKTPVRQVHALGATEDICIILNVWPKSLLIPELIQAAHDKEMHVIVLSSEKSMLKMSLTAADLEICVPGETDALIHETQLFVLSCFSDLIEQSLFGQVVE